MPFERSDAEPGLSPLFPSRISPLEWDLHIWGCWLKHVFMPINRRMLDIILLKMDLVEGDTPQCLIAFCSHATSLEVTLAQWEDKEYSNLAFVVPHPGAALDDYINSQYESLKTRQAAFLGTIRPMKIPVT